MKWHIQLSRYAVVGLTSNAVGYLLYLLLTYAGMGHKTTMTLLYAVGVAQTFYFNRRWSFSHDGQVSSAFVRYLTAYALGYVFNLAVLMILVDRWGWPHQWVQGVMIFVLAGMLFLMQRYWVFRSRQVLSS
jgi:putative flippase GtrA